MFMLFYLIHKIFRGKFIYKYVILIFILGLLALHFLGKINHYVDGYFVIFFSVLAFFLFFGDVISLVKDIIDSIKERHFKRSTFVVQISSLVILTGLYAYMYVFLLKNVDDTFFNIYKIEFQYQGKKYMSAYFNDKYIFSREP